MAHFILHTHVVIIHQTLCGYELRSKYAPVVLVWHARVLYLCNMLLANDDYIRQRRSWFEFMTAADKYVCTKAA